MSPHGNCMLWFQFTEILGAQTDAKQYKTIFWLILPYRAFPNLLEFYKLFKISQKYSNIHEKKTFKLKIQNFN